jgi:hypothetical protein
MFLKGKSIVPAILFLGVVILLVLMFSSNSCVPYSKNTAFHQYSNYEGFAEGADYEKTKSEEEEEEENKKESMSPNKETKDTKEAFEDRMEQTVLGYSSLNNVDIIDKFSHVDASNKSVDCYSAGLSNSKGPICLTPELIGLLKTRGGNM